MIPVPDSRARWQRYGRLALSGLLNGGGVTLVFCAANINDTGAAADFRRQCMFGAGSVLIAAGLLSHPGSLQRANTLPGNQLSLLSAMRQAVISDEPVTRANWSSHASVVSSAYLVSTATAFAVAAWANQRPQYLLFFLADGAGLLSYSTDGAWSHFRLAIGNIIQPDRFVVGRGQVAGQAFFLLLAGHTLDILALLLAISNAFLLRHAYFNLIGPLHSEPPAVADLGGAIAVMGAGTAAGHLGALLLARTRLHGSRLARLLGGHLPQLAARQFMRRTLAADGRGVFLPAHGRERASMCLDIVIFFFLARPWQTTAGDHVGGLFNLRQAARGFEENAPPRGLRPLGSRSEAMELVLHVDVASPHHPALAPLRLSQLPGTPQASRPPSPLAGFGQPFHYGSDYASSDEDGKWSS